MYLKSKSWSTTAWSCSLLMLARWPPCLTHSASAWAHGNLAYSNTDTQNCPMLTQPYEHWLTMSTIGSAWYHNLRNIPVSPSPLFVSCCCCFRSLETLRLLSSELIPPLTSSFDFLFELAWLLDGLVDVLRITKNMITLFCLDIICTFLRGSPGLEQCTHELEPSQSLMDKPWQSGSLSSCDTTPGNAENLVSISCVSSTKLSDEVVDDVCGLMALSPIWSRSATRFPKGKCILNVQCSELVGSISNEPFLAVSVTL